MSDPGPPPPRSVVLRRMLGGLASIGLDLRPWAERQRARMNRPVAERLEAELARLRADIAARDAALRTEAARLVETARAEAAQRHADAAGQLAEARAAMSALQAEALRQAAMAREEAAQQAEQLRAKGAEREASLRLALAAAEEQAACARQRLARLEERADAAEVLAMHAARQALATPAATPAADAAPEVSVIMAVRDRAALLGQAIRSVQAQDGVAWELIVVDDGSTDGLLEAMAPFRPDPRITLLRTPPRGQSAARNTGLAAARGALIAYLDSDNAWFPGFLAQVAEAFRQDPSMQSAYGLLLAEEAIHDGSALLWRATTAAQLEQRPSIDLNTYVHRRSLLERAGGGFDEAMRRLVDWDLTLRQADVAAPRRLPVPAVAYRTRNPDRVTLQQPYGPSLFRMRRKRIAVAAGDRAPKVLYAVWHYPQITESYIETELRCMQRLGAQVEVWSEADVAAPYPPGARVHRGRLEDAIAAVRPDVVHVHWLNKAIDYAPVIAAAGLPMTVRGHGFEGGGEAVRALFAEDALERLYLFPGMAGLAPPGDPRVRTVPAAFDTTLFRPRLEGKDRRMVLRTAAALPSKDLDLVFDLAGRLPRHRFVLVAGTCLMVEAEVDALRARNAARGHPVDLRIDVPREEVAALMEEAGIYLHTALPPGRPGATPIGAPISIAEAMATGAHVLVRDIAPLADYVGPAGATYPDADAAEALIRATAGWDDAAWRRAAMASVDRAWSLHADETTLEPIFADWCAIAADRPARTRRAPEPAMPEPAEMETP